MLSDESSSDSETGRFKCSSEKKEVDRNHSSSQRENRNKSRHGRSFDDSRFRREIDRKGEGNSFSRRSPVRNRSSRRSTSRRRRFSRDRSADRRRRSPERHRQGRSHAHSSNRDSRKSDSKERRRDSQSRSKKSPEQKRNFREEIKRNMVSERAHQSPKDEGNICIEARTADIKEKKSEVHSDKDLLIKHKIKSISPVPVKASKMTDAVQPASYYSMIPVVKEISEGSSVTDSSDDERLRAKLLNLEKELDKTRKKKHRKKHKRKSCRSKTKENHKEVTVTVEVSSTTDIQENLKTDSICIIEETPEVSSTQTKAKKESSEEGEITSENDDLSKEEVDIDPNDLRHKLKRTVKESSKSPDLREMLKSKGEICGPALPPHLEKRFKKSVSPDAEGPVLPPSLKNKDRNIGPSIPSELRVVLAEADRTVVSYASSEEDVVGPLPAGSEDKWTDAHQKLEERALDIKIRKLKGHGVNSSDMKKREEWMLELPDAKAKYIGVEARTFRAKEGPDMSDRSSWTDTPEQKARKVAGLPPEEDTKVDLQDEARAKHIAIRDMEQEHAAKKHKKKHRRDESLLEMHEKKLKKKKKKEERDDNKKERRPFSRDVDLAVNRFDEAQKKAIIKKSQNLDSRFSRGEAKYL